MSRLLFRPRALHDLRELISYIAADKPQSAERMHDAILESCQIIGDNPLVAMELEGLSVSGIRRLPVKYFTRYSIFYRITETGVEIIRLGFGGRDWESKL